MKSRRQFLLQTIPAVVGVSIFAKADAQAVHLEETAPNAVALGYKHDASKVDSKKYPTYAAGKNCATCALFQGKAGDSWAVCAAMGGKQVNAKGWCMAWAKKA